MFVHICLCCDDNVSDSVQSLTLTLALATRARTEEAALRSAEATTVGVTSAGPEVLAPKVSDVMLATWFCIVLSDSFV